MKAMILFLKAVKTKAAQQGGLFDQQVTVAGHTTSHGTFVAPYQAKRKHALKPTPEANPAPAPAPESLPINQSREFPRRGGFARRAIYSVVQTIEATDPYGNAKLYDIVRLTNDSTGRKKVTYQLYPQDSQTSLVTDASSREQLLAHLPRISLTIRRQSQAAP